MKTRAQERAASTEPGASQEPLNRKRRASSASQVSSVHDASQNESQPVIKKRKKTKAIQTSHVNDSIGHPQLSIVREESLSQVDVQTNDSSQLDVPIQGSSGSQVSSKTTKHRRVTISPPHMNRDSQASQASRSRKSLPANYYKLNGSPNSRAAGMVSLDLLVQQRIKRRQERLSVPQVDGPDDVDVAITEPAHDMLVYADIDGPSQLSPTPSVDSVNGMSYDVDSPTSAVDSAIGSKSDQERIAFEDSIKRLAREAAEAKSDLEILTVELQSMGFAPTVTDPTAVLSSIRTSFDTIRSRLHNIMPMETSEEVLENALLMNITDQLLHLAHQNDIKDRKINEKTVLETDLLVQIDALVDKLTDAELYRKKLEATNGQFESQNEQDERYIKELDIKLQEVAEQHAHVSELFSRQVEQIKVLQHDQTNLEGNCQKLKSALASYRESEDKLHKLITRMEQEHADTVAQLEQDHQKQHDQLAAEIQEEALKREAAERDAADRVQKIDELAHSLAKETEMLNNLRAQIEQVRADRLIVEGDKATAKEDAERKADEIEDLQLKLAETTAAVDKLTTQLVDLQDLNESEKRQREAAETELDESQVKVKDLNDKLHKQGIQANELRQKLFEIQQHSEKTSMQLQTRLEKQQVVYDTDMAEESARREEAETLAEDRQSIISELEKQLGGLEDSMRKALDEKESLLQSMEDRAIELQDELDAKDTKLANLTADYTQLGNDTTAKITSLTATIDELKQDLSTTTSTLAKVRDSSALQQRQMSDTLHDRDATITNLQAHLTSTRAHIDILETEKSSLERRVESEAESMLTYQGEKEEQVTSLNRIIKTKQTEIVHLGDKAAEVDRAWKNLMRERDERIAELTMADGEKHDLLAAMHDRNAELKAMFHAFADQAKAALAAQKEELDRLRKKAGADGDVLGREAEAIMSKMEEDVAVEAYGNIDVHVDGVGQVNGGSPEMSEVTPVQRVMQRKVRRSKKVRDSGIGGSSDVEAAMV